jgi:two-component sensor histidine kinase
LLCTFCIALVVGVLVLQNRWRTTTIIQAIPDLFTVIDRDGFYRGCNNHGPVVPKNFSGRLIGKNLADVHPGDDAKRLLCVIRRAIDGESPVEVEYELEYPDGVRTFECRCVRLGRDRAICFARDITSRLRRERLIRQTLNEKEVLLREVNHRVKNNLQFISSLVALQEEQLVDALDRSLMQDTQRRIQSMAHLHELLYESHNIDSVDIAVYLSDLVDDIVLSACGAGEPVRVKKEIGSVRLSLDEAFPLGLIVNEVLSVVLKSMMSGDSGGIITVSLIGAPHSVVLDFSVEGSSWPALSPDETRNSIGHVLVPSLIHQLRGTIERRSGEPGGYRIEFPRMP